MLNTRYEIYFSNCSTTHFEIVSVCARLIKSEWEKKKPPGRKRDYDNRMDKRNHVIRLRFVGVPNFYFFGNSFSAVRSQIFFWQHVILLYIRVVFDDRTDVYLSQNEIRLPRYFFDIFFDLLYYYYFQLT